MKKFFTSKIFIGLFCFCLGFLTNHSLTKMTYHYKEISHLENDRIPVNPDDLDNDKLLDTMDKVQQGMLKGADFGVEIAGVEKREDDHYVYYDIPLNPNEKNHELKVSVKNGMISITENSPHSQSERQFSIDSNLDETKADVQTLKNKISIKIPKKNR